MNYLSESTDSLVKKASYLTILARSLAENMKNGNFQSIIQGQGIEFSGVREYIRGDDVRSIDWNVTARMGHPFVKIFDEERELQIFIIVDSSLSMLLKNKGKSKYQVAAETAALTTIAAEMNGCPVGAVFFDGSTYFSCKPETGRQQTMLLLTHLDRLGENQTTGSVLGSALSVASNLIKKRSLVFIFSDFRTSGYSKPLISLAQKNDVIAFRLHDKTDDELPSLGTVPFEDVESGIKMTLPSSSSKFKKQWSDFMYANEQFWRDTCSKHGIVPVVLRTDDEPVRVLNSIFSRKGRF